MCMKTVPLEQALIAIKYYLSWEHDEEPFFYPLCIKMTSTHNPQPLICPFHHPKSHCGEFLLYREERRDI